MTQPPDDADDHASSNGANGAGPDYDREMRSRLARAAGRLATSPVRAAARAARKPLEDAADGVLSAPETARVIDRMLAGSLPEDLVQSVIRHHVVERLVAGLDESGEIERLTSLALTSERTMELIDNSVDSLLQQRVLERVAARIVESGEIERTATTVLQNERTLHLIDSAVDSLIERRIPERIGRRVAQSGEIERLTSAALNSPQAMKLADDVLASDVAQHALRSIASSPEITQAITQHTTGYAEEVIGAIRRVAVRLDDGVERLLRRAPSEERSTYGGITTRGLAITLDALATLVLFMTIAGSAALVSALVGGLDPAWLAALLLAWSWAVISTFYFTLCWSSTGQTPGMRLMHLRVVRRDGTSIGFTRSIVRLIGIVLSIIPIFAGFLPVLFSKKRTGLADYLAGTVVMRTDPEDDPSTPPTSADPTNADTE